MKILFLTEAHFLKTGYAIYSSNILSRLKRDGYEVAELGVYTSDTEGRAKNCPWIFYSNLPAEHEVQDFHSDPSNHYGKFRFESAICDFKPSVVLSIRDLFMDDFVYYSPLRDRYHWMTMCPLDGLPQQPEWINIAKQVDNLFTYTDWGKKELEKYGIEATTASPAASTIYQPFKEFNKIKEAVGLKNKKIVGTIMRNQPRKLFENLIEGFAKYVNKYDPNTVLYLHTSVPDVGFNLVRLLSEHGVLSRTVFTYSCAGCNSHYPMYFTDYIGWCPKCKERKLKTSDIYSSLAEEDMSKIINMFDVYIQPACREGFGMPQVEAAACGVPVITTPYAGMNDILNKIYDVDALKIGGYKLQNQMHMYEAVIDTDSICESIHKNIHKKESNQKEIRSSFEKNYNSWESVYQIWKNKIDSVDNEKIEDYQKIPYNINTDFIIDTKQNYVEFSKQLIESFIGKRFLNTYTHYRLIRDLNQGFSNGDLNNYIVQHFEGGYSNQFNKEIAIETFTKLAKRKIFWEKKWNESINNSPS